MPINVILAHLSDIWVYSVMDGKQGVLDYDAQIQLIAWDKALMMLIIHAILYPILHFYV